MSLCETFSFSADRKMGFAVLNPSCEPGLHHVPVFACRPGPPRLTHSLTLLSISSISPLVGILQWLVALGGIAIRQSGPFNCARTAARHWYSIDPACRFPFGSARAVVFNPAKVTIQIAEPRIESDFISVSIASRGLE
jgi:hypothetical protein